MEPGITISLGPPQAQSTANQTFRRLLGRSMAWGAVFASEQGTRPNEGPGSPDGPASPKSPRVREEEKSMRTIIGAEGQVLILHISRMGGWGQVACWPNFPIAGWEAEE